MITNKFHLKKILRCVLYLHIVNYRKINFFLSVLRKTYMLRRIIIVDGKKILLFLILICSKERMYNNEKY